MGEWQENFVFSWVNFEAGKARAFFNANAISSTKMRFHQRMHMKYKKYVECKMLLMERNGYSYFNGKQGREGS